MRRMNTELLQDAALLEKRYELKRGNSNAVYQSPNNINLFTAHAPSSAPGATATGYPGIQALKGIAEEASFKYASVGEDCVFVEGPALKENTCNEHEQQYRHFREKRAKKPFQVTSSWLNIASKKQLGINQVSHNHAVYRTAVTGVYYVTVGHSDLAPEDDYTHDVAGSVRSTPIRLTRAQSLAESPLHPRFLIFHPKPGTILLFPSWLHHAADIHLGDEERVSYAFNAI